MHESTKRFLLPRVTEADIFVLTSIFITTLIRELLQNTRYYQNLLASMPGFLGTLTAKELLLVVLGIPAGFGFVGYLLFLVIRNVLSTKLMTIKEKEYLVIMFYGSLMLVSVVAASESLKEAPIFRVLAYFYIAKSLIALILIEAAVRMKEKLKSTKPLWFISRFSDQQMRITDTVVLTATLAALSFILPAHPMGTYILTLYFATSLIYEVIRTTYAIVVRFSRL